MAAAYVQGLSEELTAVSGTPAPTSASINTAASGTFLIWARDYSPSITTITDTFSNVYTPVDVTTVFGQGWYLGICLSGTGGAGHKPILTKSSGDLFGIGLAEFSGVDPSGLDGSATATTDAASPFDSPLTTGNANDLIVTVGASNSGSASCIYSPGSGFSIASGVTFTNGTDGLSTGVMTRHVSGTGTYGGNFTMSTGTQSRVVTFALKDLVLAATAYYLGGMLEF